MLARLTNIQGHQYHNITSHQYHKYITKTPLSSKGIHVKHIPMRVCSSPMATATNLPWILSTFKTGHNYFCMVPEIQTLDGFSTFLIGGKDTVPCIFQFLCLHSLNSLSHNPFFHLESWTSYLGYNTVFYLPNCVHIPYMKYPYDRMYYPPGWFLHCKHFKFTTSVRWLMAYKAFIYHLFLSWN